MIIDVECPRCHGLGETEQGPDAWDRCPWCLGAGTAAEALEEIERLTRRIEDAAKDMREAAAK